MSTRFQKLPAVAEEPACDKVSGPTPSLVLHRILRFLRAAEHVVFVVLLRALVGHRPRPTGAQPERTQSLANPVLCKQQSTSKAPSRTLRGHPIYARHTSRIIHGMHIMTHGWPSKEVSLTGKVVPPPPPPHDGQHARCCTQCAPVKRTARNDACGLDLACGASAVLLPQTTLATSATFDCSLPAPLLKHSLT